MEFHTLDVFTEARFAGNPLAVVLGADALDDAAMQAIAAEFNLSETVFVCTPQNPAHTAALRIFTPATEVPFAGHPTVGTAALLASLEHGEDADVEAIVTLEERIGLIRAGVVLSPGKPPYAEFDVPQLSRHVEDLNHREAIAAALGLTGSQIGFANHRPAVYDAGLPFSFVPVPDLAALGRLAPITPLWEKAGMGGSLVFAYTGASEEDFRARMFAPFHGVPEDPATGSAAAAFAGVVARFSGLGDGWHRLMIGQGVEMGRPSRISLELEIAAGRLTATRIGGHAVPVMSGTLGT